MAVQAGTHVRPSDLGPRWVRVRVWVLSPCVLNAAGGASDTPFATPREPYRVKDFQNSRFLRARALSGMALLKAINTHFCMRSRDLNGLATERSVISGRVHALCTEISPCRSSLHFLGYMDAQETERAGKEAAVARQARPRKAELELPVHRRSWSSHTSIE
jgi:hypothetical protein